MGENWSKNGIKCLKTATFFGNFKEFSRGGENNRNAQYIPLDFIYQEEEEEAVQTEVGTEEKSHGLVTISVSRICILKGYI